MLSYPSDLLPYHPSPHTQLGRVFEKKNPAVRAPVSQHRCGRPGRSVYGKKLDMLRHAEMLPRGA